MLTPPANFVAPWSLSERISNYPFADSTNLIRKQKLSGEIENGKILLVDGTELYPFMGLNIVRAWDDPELDLALTNSTSDENVLEVIEQRGFTHLLFSGRVIDAFYNRKIVIQLRKLVERFPESIIVSKRSGELLAIVSEIKVNKHNSSKPKNTGTN